MLELTASLSVVIVARNEARRLPALLADLAPAGCLLREVLVVDGGSEDGTAAVAALAGAQVVRAAAGRGRQLAEGVAASRGAWLLLLHADGRLPERWHEPVAAAMASGSDAAWAFDLAIDAADPCLRLVEWAVALRSRWRRLPYGDQGLLLSRWLYERAGGVRPLPLMEDLDMVLRLRRLAVIRSLGLPLRVDGRRWQRLGVWQTVWANAWLRRRWRQGVSPSRLAADYYNET